MGEVFYGLESGKFVERDEDDAEYVLVDIKTYHGLKNALRIVRDRAVQQVEKAQADEHGYTLLRAEKRKYMNHMIWLVTVRSPYSVAMRESAYSMIAQDLKDFYGMEDLPEVPLPMSNGAWRPSTVKEILDVYTTVYERGIEVYKPEQIEIFKWLDRSEGKVVVGLEKFSANYSSGFFEVSYWTTCI